VNHRQRLVLLARWPAPARCKRRLAVALGAERAAAVQQRLLRHGLATAREAARQALSRGQRLEVVLAVGGLGPRASRRWGSTLPVDRLVDQGRGSLGVKLRRQVVRARRDGVRQLVLIGTDLPHLHSSDLLSAFSALQSCALVLGPASDGGYWLMGLCPQTSAVRLFAGARGAIAWGSDRVLRQTLEAARVEGFTPVLLPERADLDRPSDLLAWR
jgi:rSAM/selenodomain-associated transferase 1